MQCGAHGCSSCDGPPSRPHPTSGGSCPSRAGCPGRSGPAASTACSRPSAGVCICLACVADLAACPGRSPPPDRGVCSGPVCCIQYSTYTVQYVLRSARCCHMPVVECLPIPEPKAAYLTGVGPLLQHTSRYSRAGSKECIRSNKSQACSPRALMCMLPLSAASWCGLSSTAGSCGWRICRAPTGPEGKSQSLAPEAGGCSGFPGRCCQQGPTGSRRRLEGPDRCTERASGSQPCKSCTMRAALPDAAALHAVWDQETVIVGAGPLAQGAGPSQFGTCPMGP